MAKRPLNLTYVVDDEPPLAATLLLGFQHVFLITISLIFPVVIVRSIGGTPEEAEFMVSMSMLAAGMGTVLHALNRRGVGSGYLCPSLCGPSFLSASLLAANVGGLHLLFGMTSVAGLFEVLLSRWIHRLRGHRDAGAGSGPRNPGYDGRDQRLVPGEAEALLGPGGDDHRLPRLHPPRDPHRRPPHPL
ncbi:MAG: solute carrier family 23 protein [Methanothrix sp.]|nr:solute carrier family 23 protein [Methanothrix sp.]MDD3709608.1 solute carrier family 23 protein [Methanothrix sp.]MDD5768818.1 solute carrier family 23 protein [Methanothrix sp.]